MGKRKFIIETAANGEPFYSLIGGNGETMLTSETFSSKQALLESLETLKGKRMPTTVIDFAVSRASTVIDKTNG